MITQRIEELETKLLDIEYKRITAKLEGIERKSISLISATRSTVPEPVREARKVPAPATPAPGSLELRIEARPSGTRYEMRSGSGEWISLPGDRAKWPSELREAQEHFDALDSMRKVDGRLIGYCNSPISIA